MTYKTCLLTALLPLALLSCSNGDESNIDTGALSGGMHPGGWGTRAASSSSGNAPKGIKAGARIRVTGGTLRVRCDGSSGEGIESKYSGSDAAILSAPGMTPGTGYSLQ